MKAGSSGTCWSSRARSPMSSTEWRACRSRWWRQAPASPSSHARRMSARHCVYAALLASCGVGDSGIATPVPDVEAVRPIAEMTVPANSDKPLSFQGFAVLDSVLIAAEARTGILWRLPFHDSIGPADHWVDAGPQPTKISAMAGGSKGIATIDAQGRLIVRT